MEIKRITNPIVSEIIFRILLWASFIFMELLTPFQRVILAEEMWMYKYPHTGFQYVPASLLWMVSIIVPMTILTFDYLTSKNRPQYCRGILCLTLILGLNGFLTVFLKITIGRPRPDFFYRCFPDGVANANLECTGDKRTIMEGRKSFPSGHASFSFASMTFVTLYFVNRLKVLEKHRGNAWRLMVCLFPLIVAAGISISRTCDYHHHWQDVSCGGLIGSAVAYVCYNQYFANVMPTAKANTSYSPVVDD